MDTFLETLKVRVEEAHKRFAAAQQELQAAQIKLNAASQEYGAWHHAYAVELAKENQKNPPIEAQKQIPDPAVAAISNGSEGNKTEMVRELLRQHPTGMTPGDIWTKMDKQMKNRAYLYSVLKRLKDRGDARERRGKYYLVPKIEESQMVQ
jgi:hypothetical protein